MSLNSDSLTEELGLSSRIERRAAVLANMNQAVESGNNCFKCEGYCCTFFNNSMQITPIEAYDLYQFLKVNNRLDQKLIEGLNQCIKEFRLDQEIGMGKGRELRRSYTCPFFNSGPKGCSIAPESKPYGCLAFNPLESGVAVEGKCASSIISLEKRETDNSDEENMSQKIKDTLNLHWSKKNIPMALLDLIERFNG